MKQTGNSSAALPRSAGSGLFLAVAVLAFFSLAVFGYGVFLHSAATPSSAASPPAGKSQGKPAVHAGGKGKVASTKTAPAKTASAKTKTAGQSGSGERAFPAMLAGGIGLLLSALAALGLSHSLRSAEPKIRRIQEAEKAALLKQKTDFDTQRNALQSQLQEAKQRKAETETLREQVSRQFQEFFRTLPVPCFCFAANGRIIRWNAACETLYGIPAAAALESSLWDTIIPVSEREETEAKFSRVLAGESLLTMERWDTVAGGTLCRLRCSMVPLYDADGTIIGGLSAGVDMTEYTQYEKQIAELSAELEAVRIELTQISTVIEAPEEKASASLPAEAGILELSGHPAFRSRLSGEFDRAARYHSPLSLVVLDLDNFVARNRNYGFEAGDQALQSALKVIKSKIRTVDVIARLGADEYAIILPETGEAGARVAAERLRAGIAGISTNGQPPLSACFGVTQLTPEVSGADALVARALEALANARASGADTVVHYQDIAANPEADMSYQAAGRQKVRK